MSTLDPSEITPQPRRKLTQKHDVVFIAESTFGTGVDLDLLAHRRRKRRRLKHRRWVRRQQRRYQILRNDTHWAWVRQYRNMLLSALPIDELWVRGRISTRERRRQLAQLFVVRARLGR